MTPIELARDQFYALKRTNHRGETHYWHFFKSLIQMHLCMGKEPEPIYLVSVTEDPQGTYYGWKDKDFVSSSGNKHYSMIFPNEILYRVCFPYGPEAEERRGRGSTVRLSVREECVIVESKQEEP